jgi:hypothetical protein
MARKRSAKERVAPAGSIRRIRARVQEGRPMKNAGMRAEASRGSAGIPRENDAPRRQEVGRHGGRRSALEGERRAMSTTARPSPLRARCVRRAARGEPKTDPPVIVATRFGRLLVARTLMLDDDRPNSTLKDLGGRFITRSVEIHVAGGGRRKTSFGARRCGLRGERAITRRAAPAHQRVTRTTRALAPFGTKGATVPSGRRRDDERMRR